MIPDNLAKTLVDCRAIAIYELPNKRAIQNKRIWMEDESMLENCLICYMKN